MYIYIYIRYNIRCKSCTLLEHKKKRFYIRCKTCACALLETNVIDSMQIIDCQIVSALNKFWF